MTPEQRKIEEEQIKNNFSELQKELKELELEINSETDSANKESKEQEFGKLETEVSQMKHKIDTLSSLEEADLELLKTKLESIKKAYQEYRGEVVDLQNEKYPTPTTYELLKDSETCKKLVTIISSNPNEFKDLPGDSAEAKLEYIFSKIRNSIVLFMKNKLGDSEKYSQVINDTIVPAFERSLIELLRDQGNETNISMLQGLDKISFGSFGKLFRGAGKFAKKAAGSYDKFSQWMNAIDYLSVHNGVLNNPEKSKVLTNPLKFKEYINNPVFNPKDENGDSVSFSPYSKIDKNIFEIDGNKDFEFGISLQEKQSILAQIGHIDIVNNARTTSLITKMLDKPEQFLQRVEGLQETANGILDGVNSLNSVTKRFGVDILGEISKAPEQRNFLYRILDFICKLIGITGGLEGIVKRWRLDRMNLTDAKNENISKIFEQYKELVGENTSLSITDENSCREALKDFTVTNAQDEATTKGDYLRDSMVDNMNISLINPFIVQQILGDSYIKKETTQDKGKTKERFVVDESKITEDDKLKLAKNHIINMKAYLEKYNDNDLKDFYTNIHSTEDIVLCITASLYADKDDVIEGIKAKVFLPENYGSFHSDGTIEDSIGSNNISELTPYEQSEMQDLVEQSKIPNTINYLENPTYKKYLNIIERDLGLPKHALECVCFQESKGNLYKGNGILGSGAGAKGLFQFMPATADQYMKHSKLGEKYGKTFASREEFLKDPLASAWAAGILYSEFMNTYNYNFQSSLACYNRGIGNYRKKFGDKNLTTGDLYKLPSETKAYVENVTKNVLQHNSASYNNIFVDLGKYSWNGGIIDNNLQHSSETLIGPELLAKNKNEIGGLGNSIMVGFQGYSNKLNFPNMDGYEGKSTQTHPHGFKSILDVQGYKAEHPEVKSFMFYFGANTDKNGQTLSDIKRWSEWLQEEGIQPVLCTCIGEDNHTWLTGLNQSIRDLGKEKYWPIFDFAKPYNKGDIAMGGGESPHPTSDGYSTMAGIITEHLGA